MALQFLERFCMARVSLIDHLHRWRWLVKSPRMSHTCHTLIISGIDDNDHQRTIKRPKRQPNSNHRVVSVIGNVEGVGIVPGVSLVRSKVTMCRLRRPQCTSNHVKSRQKGAIHGRGKGRHARTPPAQRGGIRSTSGFLRRPSWRCGSDERSRTRRGQG